MSLMAVLRVGIIDLREKLDSVDQSTKLIPRSLAQIVSSVAYCRGTENMGCMLIVKPPTQPKM